MSTGGENGGGTGGAGGTGPGTGAPKDEDPGKTGGTGPGTENLEDDDDDDDGDSDTPPADWKEQLAKAQRAATRRDNALRKAQGELAELKKGTGGKTDPPPATDPKDDPVARANVLLVKGEARTALAGLGVTDRKVQAEILNVLDLSGIEVDDSGEVDADALGDRFEVLRKAFGGTKGTTRTLPRTDTRDRGGAQGGGTTTDPDTRRYQNFLTGK